jgi:SpoIID/LytB domain protein
LEDPPRSWSGIAKIGAKDRFRWTVTRSAEELARLLGPLGLGELRAIEVTERGVSGRALAVKLVGARRTEVVRGELRIRRTFGDLRSSLFIVTLDGSGAATFRGGGFGHGVGMCQTGAVGMAENGKTYRQILQHYYSGSTLRKLW